MIISSLVTALARVLYLNHSSRRDALAQAQQAAGLNEEKLKLALAASNMGVWEWDVRTNVAEWSPECFQIMGVTHFKRTLEGFTELVHPDDLPGVMAAVDKAIAAKGIFSAEFRAIRPDGEVRWLSNIGRANYDEQGQPLRLIGTVTDITERKRAESELSESERRFATFMDNIPGNAWIKNLEGRYVYANKMLVENIFKGSDRWRAKTDDELWEPEIARQFKSNDQLVMASGESLQTIESYYLEKQLRFVLVSKFPLRDLSGKIILVAGMAIDVTERRKVEDELQIANERLRQLSRRLLEVQESERRELARELHDEIGQSLTALLLDLRSAQRSRDKAQLDARLQESLDLADKILFEVRNLSVDLRPSVLDDLGLLPALRWHIDRQQQRLDIPMTLIAEPLSTSPSRQVETACFRIVQEALTNIARHAQAATVVVQLRQVGDQLTLSIRDDGKGFDVALQRERATAGNSFGLLGMNERASLNGGSLTIESASGRGTEIRATFPLPVLPSETETPNTELL